MLLPVRLKSLKVKVQLSRRVELIHVGDADADGHAVATFVGDHATRDATVDAGCIIDGVDLDMHVACAFPRLHHRAR